MERKLTFIEKVLTTSLKVLSWGIVLLFICGFCVTCHNSIQPKYIVYEERELILLNVTPTSFRRGMLNNN